MSQATASSRLIDAQVQVRMKVRDGWLFLAIGLAAGILAIISSFFAAYYKDDLATLLVVIGCAGWLILTNLGLASLWLASLHGQQLGKGYFWAGLYCLLGTVISLCVICRGNVYVAQAMLALNLVWWALSARNTARLGRAEFGVSLAALGFVQYAYAIAILTLLVVHERILWYALTDVARFTSSQMTVQYLTEWQMGVPLSARAAGVVIYLSLAAMAAGLIMAKAAALGGTPPIAARWTWRLVSFFVTLVATTIVLMYPFESFSGLVAMLALPFSLLLALSLGLRLARWRRPEASRGRIIVCCAPLAALALLLVVPAVGCIGSVLDRQRGLTPSHLRPNADWAFSLPEQLRVPIAGTLGRLSRQLSTSIYSCGLPSTQALRAEALSGALGGPRLSYDVWVTWRNRDPEDCLATALAVPPSPTPNIPATRYDGVAGYTIAAQGSREDIAARLSGAYSSELKRTVLITLLYPRYRPGFFTAVRQAWETDGVSDHDAWRYLGHDPVKALLTLRQYLSDPTPQNLARLYRSAESWGYNFPRGFELVGELLMSQTPAQRKIASNALRQSGYSGAQAATVLREHGRRLIASARGQLPGNDEDEQRLASDALLWLLQGVGFNHLGDRLDINAAATPLLPNELQRIQAVCKQAEEQLAQPHKSEHRQ